MKLRPLFLRAESEVLYINIFLFFIVQRGVGWVLVVRRSWGGAGGGHTGLGAGVCKRDEDLITAQQLCNSPP